MEHFPFPHLSTRHVSVIAVFAAVQAVATIIPVTITIGVSGSITLGVVTAPLVGFLLGPTQGGISVLLGSLIGLFLNPSGAIFGALTAVPPALGAVGAGCVRLKRGYVPGIVILLSICLFYAHPFGRAAILYPWLHIVAMIVAFSPLAALAGTYFSASGLRKITVAVALAAFVGTLTDHASGSAMGIWYYNLPASIWNVVMYVYPIERIVTVLIVTAIGAPVYKRLKSSRMLDVF